MMKLRIRFQKKGVMIYIGHLDLMRYFQKLFRRCGFDVSYSQGFNPHQLMSFASPLGLGITGMAEYMDVQVESFTITDTCNDRVGETLSVSEWIDRINEYSTDMVIVTGIYILPDKVKPSMSLLAACAYELYDIEPEIIKDIIDYFNSTENIVYMKQTKKSVKEIDLKKGILAVADNIDDFIEIIKSVSVNDVDYLSENVPLKDGLFILCLSGSELNIKPEMLIELYSQKKGIDFGMYDTERIEMYSLKDKYVSMSMDVGE